ncbi:MAG: hypothetical protein ABIS28_15095 [Caldimonas sp.]
MAASASAGAAPFIASGDETMGLRTLSERLHQALRPLVWAFPFVQQRLAAARIAHRRPDASTSWAMAR